LIEECVVYHLGCFLYTKATVEKGRQKMRTITWKMAALFIAGIGTGSPLCASQRMDQVSVDGGVFDILRERHRTFELGMEYKFYPGWPSPFDFLDFRPLLGLMANMKMSTYLYGGINFDLFLTKHFVIVPGFSAGWYNKGDGKNLGYPIEFRTSVEISLQMEDQSRLGLRFYHLSNAGLGSKNPGSESIVFLYDIPVRCGFPFSKQN
jgi:lipid A 3-O-deacylase